MLHRCNEIESRIDRKDCEQTIGLESGTIELYLGKSADRLSALGLLNIVMRDQHDQLSGWSIESIKNSGLTVKHQEAMREPNTSTVMNIWVEGSELCAQHWEGFISRFDGKTMKIVSQAFTK